jgi:hypothetical protein
MIDLRAQHPRNAPAGIEANFEPAQNETTSRQPHSAKHFSPRNATDDGILIRLSCWHAQNARLPIEDSRDNGPNFTDSIELRELRQKSSILSISSSIATSDALP